MTDSTAISIRQLRVVRGDNEVLHGLDLDVEAGQITGLLGPSGCGKSTLMRSIVGVQVVRSGTVTVLGQPAGSAGLRSRVGYVTQAPAVYDDLTVAENLRYFGRILRVTPQREQEVMRSVGLGGFAGRQAGKLSGGQRARVSLATALLNSPDVLVLDEPTAGLDPLLREELWDVFHQLAAGGAALLVSSHVMDEAGRCDRLVLMREGAVLAAATPAEILQRTGATTMEEAFLRLIRSPEIPA